MTKLDFLSVIHDPGAQPAMNLLLEQFRQQYGHDIQGNFVSWDTLWRETTNIGIYKRGADIAETGSTWLEGLLAMHCLRPFTAKEIARLGGKEAFLTPTWNAVTIGDSEQVWGIPVRADARVLWYWEDLFEQVKLDPLTALSGFDRFPETFEILKAAIDTPWGIITPAIDANSLQTLASWVWDAGGEFVSKDGKKVLFTEAAARKGMRTFFELFRYMPKTHTHMSGNDTGQLFAKRKIAVTIAGPWMMADLAARKIPTDKVKAIPIPGPGFVGGTVMSIYEHCRVPGAALDFLEFITTPENQIAYAPLVGLLPTRHATWNLPSHVNAPYYQTIYKALEQGRSYPSVPLWGVIEQKLLNAVANTWNKLLSQENPDIDAIIDENFIPLARRLELSLNG